MKPVSYVCFFNVMNHAVYIRIEQQLCLVVIVLLDLDNLLFDFV